MFIEFGEMTVNTDYIISIVPLVRSYGDQEIFIISMKTTKGEITYSYKTDDLLKEGFIKLRNLLLTVGN